MNYSETLEYIHSVHNYFCKPGLARITELCSYLGNPQDDLRFVHVAGTNGKGSFCSILTKILKNAGYKVGTYTSPYVLNFNERISVCGKTIADDELVKICEHIRPFCESMEDKPTEFEIITAIAFEYFKRQKCDIVVLECGMGGRFDATNIIKEAELSVITGVNYDHQNFLGNTIREIAGEKAGIIKNGGKCLWCGQNDEAESVIKEYIYKHNADLVTVDHSLVNVINSDLTGTIFDFKEYKSLFLPLLSCYQPINAANAITAAELLRQSGFKITEDNIYNGLKNVRWRARFELLCRNPVIIFDGAHNPEGIAAATDSIKYYFGSQRVNVLSGVMSDKDYRSIAKSISEVADSVYCVTPDNARALSSNDYAGCYDDFGVKAASFDDINTALNAAVNDSIESDRPLICLGSLYMYNEVYYSLKKLNKIFF